MYARKNGPKIDIIDRITVKALREFLAFLTLSICKIRLCSSLFSLSSTLSGSIFFRLSHTKIGVVTTSAIPAMNKPLAPYAKVILLAG